MKESFGIMCLVFGVMGLLLALAVAWLYYKESGDYWYVVILGSILGGVAGVHIASGHFVKNLNKLRDLSKKDLH